METAAADEHHAADELDLTMSGMNLSVVPAMALQPLLHFLDLSSNAITVLPEAIGELKSLCVPWRASLSSHAARRVQLNLAKNRIAALPAAIGSLSRLVRLDVSNNLLADLPFELARLTALDCLYLGGNALYKFPAVLCAMPKLRRLYLGANRLTELPDSIAGMAELEVLYLGGNQLTSVHPAVGSLQQLGVLYLGDNRLDTLPPSLGNLSSLRSLNLHGNQFRVLPPEILALTSLEQLALRNNPLVSDFINEIPSEVPALTELCGRFIKSKRLSYHDEGLPGHVVRFLDSAKSCTNPACAGVYFTHHRKTVNFVDVCGKYRVPLMNFLCAACPEDRPHGAKPVAADKVLLTGYTEPLPDQ